MHFFLKDRKSYLKRLPPRKGILFLKRTFLFSVLKPIGTIMRTDERCTAAGELSHRKLPSSCRDPSVSDIICCFSVPWLHDMQEAVNRLMRCALPCYGRFWGYKPWCGLCLNSSGDLQSTTRFSRTFKVTVGAVSRDAPMHTLPGNPQQREP